jgi:outer membrane protein OmpA-like peptidoglycan-associated protein
MARLFRFTGLWLGLALAPLGAAAQEPGVRVDRSVLDALGPAPRQPFGPGVEAPSRSEPRRAAPRAPQRRPAAEETKDGVVSVPPPPPIAAPAPREEGAPRPLAPSLLPPTVRAAQPQPQPQPQAQPPAAPTPAPPPPAAAAAPPSAAPPPAPATPPPPAATASLPRPATPPPPPATVAPAPPPPAAAAPPPPTPPPAAPPQAAPPPAPAAPPPAVTPVVATAAGAQTLRLGFTGAETELNAAARQRVLGFAGSIPEDEQVRITVNAYAGGDPSDPSRARRTSLSRALAVRAALMEGGIRSTRIDVRALGLAAADGPADRVDIVAGPVR